MQVTYLGHSGFLLEWDSIYCLFDYDTGKIPELDERKALFVFVSHAHGDHYNRNIWQLRKNHPEVHYIVSKDVPLSAAQRIKLGLGEPEDERIVTVKADEVYHLPKQITVKTLRSTDEGVAFLVSYGDQTVFHAGDLNLWTWEEESAPYNKDMTQRFMAEMEKLREVPLDLAFFPLDPRQGPDCGKGLAIFNRMTAVKVLFPMHFWKKYDTITRYRKEHPAECANLAVIEYEGQVFDIGSS